MPSDDYRIEASHEYKMEHDYSYRVQFEPDERCGVEHAEAEAETEALLRGLWPNR